jgi:hypothetical protein
VLQHLQRAGASFFPDLVRHTRLLKSEVETALWELVAAGLVTADGFDNLRALVDPRRRSGHGSGRSSRPRHSAGRWYVLHAGEPVDRADADRVDVPDAAESLWRRIQGAARARVHPAALARAAHHIQTARRSR